MLGQKTLELSCHPSMDKGLTSPPRHCCSAFCLFRSHMLGKHTLPGTKEKMCGVLQPAWTSTMTGKETISSAASGKRPWFWQEKSRVQNTMLPSLAVVPHPLGLIWVSVFVHKRTACFSDHKHLVQHLYKISLGQCIDSG